MSRTRAYRRYVRNKQILRKKNIAVHTYGFDYYEHDGQYSKNKIHCSCGICKFGKKFGLPTTRDEREMSREKILINDYYSE